VRERHDPQRIMPQYEAVFEDALGTARRPA
jgi:hypothetical protein